MLKRCGAVSATASSKWGARLRVRLFRYRARVRMFQRVRVDLAEASARSAVQLYHPRNVARRDLHKPSLAAHRDHRTRTESPSPPHSSEKVREAMNDARSAPAPDWRDRLGLTQEAKPLPGPQTPETDCATPGRLSTAAPSRFGGTTWHHSTSASASGLVSSLDWASQPYNTLILDLRIGPYMPSCGAVDRTRQAAWALVWHGGLIIAKSRRPVLGAMRHGRQFRMK